MKTDFVGSLFYQMKKVFINMFLHNNQIKSTSSTICSSSRGCSCENCMLREAVMYECDLFKVK